LHISVSYAGQEVLVRSVRQ